MSSFPDNPSGSHTAALRTDTLTDSVLILLALTVVQRLVGFCRAILFCRWLDAEQLGQWDMALNFLMLAGPMSVLALTGCFRRYAEHYRRRRQLRTLIARLAAVCAVLAALAAGFLLVADRWLSRLIFGTPDRTDLVTLLAGSLLAVVAFNYFVELFSALRNVRLIAGLQLLSSVAFAGLGISLLLGWQCNAVSVLIAYGGACALGAAAGIGWLLRHWRALPEDAGPPPYRELWSKLLPFAVSIWAASVLANLFVIADRYMIIHHCPLSTSEALAQVGEYHSSRVLPMLLVSIAAVLASIVTAHLSHDWEAGRRDRVAARLNLFLKLFGFALSAAAILMLLAGPLLFRVAFEGKFAGGLSVLPWTLTYCVWFAVFSIAQSYLLCREKAHLASVALLVGLLANVGLNLLLLPRLHLLGAVLATTAANLVALVLICAFNHKLGFRMDAGTRAVLAVPLLYWLGPWVTAAFLAAILLEAFHSDRLLSRDEKQQILQTLADYWQRFQDLRVAIRSAGGGS